MEQGGAKPANKVAFDPLVIVAKTVVTLALPALDLEGDVRAGYRGGGERDADLG